MIKSDRINAIINAGKKFDNFIFFNPRRLSPIPIIKTPPTPVIIFIVCSVNKPLIKVDNKVIPP